MQPQWVILLCITVSCTGLGRNESPFAASPLEARIETSDVALFWQAFDRMRAEPGNPFGAHYLEKGSAGLRDFVPGRIEGATELFELVSKERDYYEQVRASTLQVDRFESQIRAAYAAMKYWYPPATFPPLYLVIGRTTSGGTSSDNGLIVALEVFADEPMETAYGRPAGDTADIPFIVAHELIHFYQREPPEVRTLLERCLREGSADFLGELIAGSRVKGLNGPRVYPYGEAHEARLWREFEAQMLESVRAPWLYSQTSDGRPQNLGYWMGYQITAAFFERAADKHRAVRDILEMRDPVAFLARSGYADAMRGDSAVR